MIDVVKPRRGPEGSTSIQCLVLQQARKTSSPLYLSLAPLFPSPVPKLRAAFDPMQQEVQACPRPPPRARAARPPSTRSPSSRPPCAASSGPASSCPPASSSSWTRLPSTLACCCLPRGCLFVAGCFPSEHAVQTGLEEPSLPFLSSLSIRPLPSCSGQSSPACSGCRCAWPPSPRCSPPWARWSGCCPPGRACPCCCTSCPPCRCASAPPSSPPAGAGAAWLAGQGCGPRPAASCCSARECCWCWWERIRLLGSLGRGGVASFGQKRPSGCSEAAPL